MPESPISSLFWPLWRLFSTATAIWRPFFTSQAIDGVHCWLLDRHQLRQWLRWREAFVKQSQSELLAMPALAGGLLDMAWLMQDTEVLEAVDTALKGLPQTPIWQAVRRAREKPRAWLLVAGAEARQWQRRLLPVLKKLPEPLTLFVMPEVVEPTPPHLDWSPQTRAVLCRGLACSSPIADLDYLLETLEDG